MKRIYKWILILTLFVVAIVTLEMYYYTKYEGNVILYVSNQSIHGDTIDIKVKIDGELIVNELFIAGDIHDFRKFSIKLSPIVIHEIEIYSEKAKAKMVSYERFLLVNWVTIDLWDGELIFREIKENEEPPIHWFTMDRYLHPIIFM